MTADSSEHLTLPVSADFSAYSCVRAEEILRTSIEEEIKGGQKLTIEGFNLKVPSQKFHEAIGVAHYFGYAAEVDFSLREDGWKLECKYRDEKYRFSKKTIYSPGA